MADRANQYPMLPHNFNPGMLQQQQQQQQQPQDGGMPHNNLDNNRLWQQMQQQLSGAQGPYRGLNGGDMNPQQMAALLKNPMLAQQMQQHQNQQQQQFGLGGQQMNLHQPSFNDTQQSQQSQLQMPHSMPGLNAAAMQASMAQRNALLQNLQQANGAGRQLELMGLAQNQQNQHGNVTPNAQLAAARLHQQQLQRQHAQQLQAQQHSQQLQAHVNGQQGMGQSTSPDNFSNPAAAAAAAAASANGMHRSPAPGSATLGGTNMTMMRANGVARQLTVEDLTIRADQLKGVLQHYQREAQDISTQRNSYPPQLFADKMREIQTEMNTKRSNYHRIMAMIQQMRQNGGNAPPMAGPSSGPAPAPPGMAPGAGGWQPGQAGPSSTQNFGSPGGPSGPQMPNRGPHPGQGIQPSPSPLHAQGGMQPQNMMSGRPGQTPQSLLASSLPASMSPPNVQTQFGMNMPGGTPSIGHARTPSQSDQPQQSDQLQHPGQQQPPRDMIMPLDRQRFLSAYKGFCESRNMPFDPTAVIENRQVDLHQLHIQVMLAGGRPKLTSGDAWAVIGGKMGFVQFPGGEGEASKCGPATAQHLMHVYETRLMAFDHMYLSSIAQRQRQAKQQMGMLAGQNGQPQPGAQPPGMGPAPGPAGANGMPAPHPQQMQRVMQFANVSAEVLRANGVPEPTIKFVETHRAVLQRNAEEQDKFRTQLQQQRGNMAGPSQQQPPQSQAPGLPPNMQNRFDQGGNLQSSPPPGMQQIVQPPRTPQPQNMGQPGPSGADGAQQGANFMSLQQQQPPMSEPVAGGSGGGSGGMPGQLSNGMEQARMQHAMQMLRQFKMEFQQRNLPNLKEYAVPDPQKFQFNNLLNGLHRKVSEIESKLPMMAYILKDDMPIRRLVWIVMITTVQRDLLGKNPPKYILDMQGLQNTVQTYGQLINAFQHQLQQHQHQQQMINAANNMNTFPPNARPQNGQPPAPGMPQQPRPPNMSMPQQQQPHPQPQIQPPRPPSQPVQPPPQQQPMQPPQSHLQPPQMQHSSSLPPAQPQQPMAPPMSNRQVSLSNPPQGKNRGQKAPVASGSAASPAATSPAAVTPAASTPANAPTPSPQMTPKSPKRANASKKAPAKAAAKRKDSKAVPPAQSASTPSTSAAPPPSQAPAEPESTQPAPSGSLKRLREEETPSEAQASQAESPPKKVKSEWEGPPSDELVKKEQDDANIKTEEDASAFIQQMLTDLSQLADSGEESSMASNMAQTLDSILNGLTVPGNEDGAGTSMDQLGLGDVVGNNSTSPSAAPAAPAEDFGDFFDFSSFVNVDEGDGDSKAPTPELISSSSTNPSPESGSEADAAGHAAAAHAGAPKTTNTEVKAEDPDPLRLGMWSQIDGGESTYFQPADNWKWDGPMPPSEQAWAISS